MPCIIRGRSYSDPMLCKTKCNNNSNFANGKSKGRLQERLRYSQGISTGYQKLSGVLRGSQFHLKGFQGTQQRYAFVFGGFAGSQERYMGSKGFLGRCRGDFS